MKSRSPKVGRSPLSAWSRAERVVIQLKFSAGDESNTVEGALVPGAANGGAGTVGENLSVQELLRALALIVNPVGEQPPWLEWRSLIRDNIRAFIREDNEY